jgi:hypothetical protein
VLERSHTYQINEGYSGLTSSCSSLRSENGGTDDDQDVREQTSTRRRKPQGTPAESFRHHGTEDSYGRLVRIWRNLVEVHTRKPTEDRQPAIHTGLGGCACNANCRQNLRQIIGDDSVTDPLRAEPNTHEDVKTLSITFGPEEAEVRNTGDSSRLCLDRRFHFVELVHDQLVVFIPVCVVFR